MVLLLAVLLDNVASVPRPQTPRARDINAAGLLIHFPLLRLIKDTGLALHCVVNYTGYLRLIGAIKSTLRNYIIEHVLKKKSTISFLK